MVFIVWKALRNILENVVGNYGMRICDFVGWWSVTLKNKGWSKKTEGRTGPKKIKGGSWAVGTYIQNQRGTRGEKLQYLLTHTPKYTYCIHSCSIQV